MKLDKLYLFHKKTQEQLIKYIIVGLIVFIADFLSLVILVELFNVPIIIAVSIAYTIGVAIHFNLNRQWNFKNFERKYHHQLKTYIAATIFFYFFSIMTIKIFLLIGLHYTVSKIATTGILAGLTFLFNKYITFNKGFKNFLREALYSTTTMHKKNKIAIITPYGAEPRFDNYAEFILAKGLIEKGYNVKFYTYKIRDNKHYQSNSTYQGVKIYRCRQRLGISPGLFFSIIKFRPQVVMMFHPRSWLNLTGYTAGKIINAKTVAEIVGILHDPFIVEDRDDPIGKIRKNINLITSYKDLFKKILSGNFLENWKNFAFHMPTAKADEIITINYDEQKYTKDFYNRDSTMIYWSIPKRQELPIEKPKDIIPNEYLFFIGQIKRRKGWDTAIQTIAHLKKQGIIKNLVFVCPSPAIEEAQKMVNRLDIKNQVTFLTQVSNEEKNWLYKNSQYVLIPSRYEGFGLPVFESFLAGKPVIATNIPVFLEFLEHKKNSMISEVGNSEAMAENIKALDQNPDLINDLVKNGYQTALEFNDEKMISNYLDFINKITAK